jgi:hypothetical protein
MKQRLSIGNLSLAREKECVGEKREALFPIPLWRLSAALKKKGKKKEAESEGN